MKMACANNKIHREYKQRYETIKLNADLIE